jgi:streptogramin lyase
MKRSMGTLALAVGLSLFFSCATGTVAGNVSPAQNASYERAGFETRLDKGGRLWVFESGSKALADYDSKGTPAKHIVRPLAGPGGITLKAADGHTIDAYLLARPGFVTRIDKRGHLWVFESGSQALADYDSKGAPAKHTVRPLAGPNQMTIKAVDGATIDQYLQATPYL